MWDPEATAGTGIPADDPETANEGNDVATGDVFLGPAVVRSWSSTGRGSIGETGGRDVFESDRGTGNTNGGGNGLAV